MNFNFFLLFKKSELKNIILILSIGIFLRIYYMLRKTGDIFLPDLGGDSCYHFNVAKNISEGIGAKTSFIFSYWFPHQNIPALTDLYGPGYHYFLSIFLLLKNEFIFLRISSLIVGILSIVIAYLIGKKLKSTTLGLLSALVICINFFHIENSTVIMRENFNLLLIQLFFLNLFYLKKSKLFFITIGLVIGYSAMTSSVWIILFIILIIYILLNFNLKKKQIYFNTLIILIFFLLTIFPWAVMTYDYFGKVLFNYMSYYPYVDDWGLMMSERGLPDTSNFWIDIDYINYLKKHFFWGINNLYKFCLIIFPTFLFPISFILIPLIIIGAHKLKSNGYIMLIFTFLYFLALLFGSYGMKGILWPRHFMPFLATTSILMSYGLLVSFYKLKKVNIIDKYFKTIINNRHYKLLFFIPIIVTIFGIEIKDSFWERDSSHFYEFGKKIKAKTLSTDKIFYANSVPDAWCATDREIVQDPAFYKIKTSSRILEEAKKFNVSYLFVDVSKHIYQRGDDINDAIKFYDKLELQKILDDKVNGFYFYKILN